MMKEREFSAQEAGTYELSEHCKLVTGTNRAAIYDLETGNIYSLNEAAQKIINEAPDKFGFWKKLSELGLAETFPSGPILEAELKIPQVGLEFMWLELTEKCNQNCLHCYSSANEANDQTELRPAKWERIIEEGADLGCRKLQFIGGEPFLFTGIFDLAQAARDLDYRIIEVFTNGTLLNEEKIEKISNLGIYVALSLYSIIPEVHDTVTQVPGSFQRTYRALEMLKEAEIPTRIGVIIMRQNQDYILETQRKLQEIGFKANRADVLRPTGRGSCADLLPENEVIQTWALMTRPDFSTSRESFYRNLYWNSCWAGKIAIIPDGGVIPCIFAREHLVGSLTSSRLEEVTKGEKLQELWQITKDKVEGCKGCEYRYACHDCRPLAEGTTGSLYAKNPRCTYDPVKGEWFES